LTDEMGVVVCVTSSDARLTDVIGLWRAHSGTLGFFPLGAFKDYAGRGCILAAIDADGALVGYVLYRESRGWVVVVHLCVSRDYRGRGVTRMLVKALRERTQSLMGLRLRCRADFEATKLWPKLGFHQAAERPAQSEGNTLLTWIMDYGAPDLFTNLDAESLPVAVLDMNIVMDLVLDDREHREEALPLLEPWVRDAFQIAVTSEIMTEIGRGENWTQRGRLRNWADSQVLLRPTPVDSEAEHARVVELLGLPTTDRAASDRRHLAHAVAGGAEVFVTRDQWLLDRAVDIHNQLGLRVERPGTLIGDLDLSRQPERYEPARLAGTMLTGRRPRAEEIDALARHFAHTADGETPSRLVKVLSASLANPASIEARMAGDADGNILSLDVSEQHGAEITISTLRLRAGTLNATMARHLVWSRIAAGRTSGVTVVRLADQYESPTLSEDLSALGFARADGGWAKLLLRGTLSRQEATDAVRAAAQEFHLGAAGFEALVDDINSAPADLARVLRAERALWPLKIRDAEVPCYLVPIQPQSALQLFDERMASESLLGGITKLLLQTENAYYKSATPAVIKGEGRVLWYISGMGQSRGYSNAGTIAAAAQITDVMIGPPRIVFRAYKRLGVFTYNDVAQIAANEARGQVLGFRFTRHEALRRPVAFGAAQKLLREMSGSKNQFMSAVAIRPSVWCALYAAGGGDG
jgi:ribosomal protein S18 acetylase RimI-like enzyme/predicted nucleic acid-binding protein